MGRLAGKRLLVTGATGMAAAAAEGFVREGARVFVTARTESNLEALAARLAEVDPAAVGYQAADLREPENVERVVLQACAQFDRLDGLFHVAGGSGRRFGDGPLHEVTLDAWNETLRLNLTTQFLVAQAVVRTLLAQGSGGSVVLMGSILGLHPAPATFPTHAYAAAKAATVGLVKATAAYYAPNGIRINAVAPSLVTTPMSRRAAEDPRTVAYAARRQPLSGGFMDAKDVVGTVIWLLADESRAVTGQVVKIDAGWGISDATDWHGAGVAEAGP